MGTKTPNYQLNQWEATDSFLRNDFNEDNAKIDAAIMAVKNEAAEALNGYKASVDAALAAAGNCRVTSGSYTGKGTYGSSNPTKLTLPFEPKLVVIVRGRYTASSGSAGYFPSSFAIFVKGASSISVVGDGEHNSCNFNMEGTQLLLRSDYGPESQFNTNGTTYHYVAIG